MAYCLYPPVRFGNRLHIAAATYAHSRRLNEPCRIEHDPLLEKLPRLKNYVEMWPRERIPQARLWYEDWVTNWHDPVVMPPPVPLLTLYGAFESAQFFEGYEHEIRDMYHLDLVPHRAVGLHVRRTDFLRKGEHHSRLAHAWYAKALEIIDRDTEVLVLSDDVPWCREQFRGPRFTFPDTGDPFADWCALRSCRDFIISNSTFAWWAAYLGDQPDKRVVAPAIWYHSAHTQSYKYVPGWRILPNRWWGD